MLSNRLKTRFTKDRPMTTITMRVPVDVVESLKSLIHILQRHRLSR